MRKWRQVGVFRGPAANRDLRRVVRAYLLFILTDNAVWIAMLVCAYSRGGARRLPGAGGCDG